MKESAKKHATAPTPDQEKSDQQPTPVSIRVRQRPLHIPETPSSVMPDERQVQSSWGGDTYPSAENAAGKSKGAYEVGFGKPPVSTRFKVGQSGNPKGRGKGNLNAATLIEEELSKTVLIRVDGKPKKITRRHAIIMAHSQLAMKGNIKAAQSLIPELGGGGRRSAMGTSSNELADGPKRASVSSTEKTMIACGMKDELRTKGFQDEAANGVLAMMGLLEFLPDDRRSDGGTDDAR